MGSEVSRRYCCSRWKPWMLTSEITLSWSTGCWTTLPTSRPCSTPVRSPLIQSAGSFVPRRQSTVKSRACTSSASAPLTRGLRSPSVLPRWSRSTWLMSTTKHHSSKYFSTFTAHVTVLFIRQNQSIDQSRIFKVAWVTCSYHKDHTEKELIYKTRSGYESRNRCSFSRFLKVWRDGADVTSLTLYSSARYLE